MARPCKRRRICCRPQTGYFKPRGIAMDHLEEISLFLDEMEALRLADWEGMYHQEAAERMGISRQTFGNILNSAHRKVADTLLHGKALRVNHKSRENDKTT